MADPLAGSNETRFHTYPLGNKTVCDTDSPIEKRFGYHRAVKKGPFVFVSGTTSLLPNGEVAHPTDARKQAVVAMTTAADAIEALGGVKADIVRIRMFVARQEDTQAVGEAFRDTFNQGDDKAERTPLTGMAATMLVVGESAFFLPDMLVEIELDAVIS